ncbi:MAG: hypothetical protein H0X01_04890 [Nitrospira sp.]|nr:hypothetical protein [Nitrospira sp.]
MANKVNQHLQQEQVDLVNRIGDLLTPEKLNNVRVGVRRISFRCSTFLLQVA